MDECMKFLMNFIFTLVGLFFFLFDIGLDIYAAVSFYQEGAYMYLGILLLFLLGSAVLVQIYSWLFYSYDDSEETIKESLSRSKPKVLDVFKLGIVYRCCEYLHFVRKHFSIPDEKGVAVYLSHDLDFLRLIETFSESAPQFVLMLTITLKDGELQWDHRDIITGLKAFGSASLITVSVTMYHRSIHSFLPDKKEQRHQRYPHWSSLVVCFLWNLFLISSRLTALALFASVLPCYIFIHFVWSWLILFLYTWRFDTRFMDSSCGGWLYRATVGLIWYFHWFNLVKGNTKYTTLLYHGYILLDNILLCSLWCWKMNTNQASFEIPQLYAIITAVCVVSVYILGLIFKVVYYECYRENRIDKKDLKGGDSSTPDGKCYNKRMRQLAENFYAPNHPHSVSVSQVDNEEHGALQDCGIQLDNLINHSV